MGSNTCVAARNEWLRLRLPPNLSDPPNQRLWPTPFSSSDSCVQPLSGPLHVVSQALNTSLVQC